MTNRETATIQGGLPLPLRQIAFLLPVDAGQEDAVAVATRVRGLIGRSLKQQSCIFDAQQSNCEGCSAREACYYGQSFKPPGPVELSGFGRVGTLPHRWSIHADLIGLYWRITLTLIGRECLHISQWQQAIVSACPQSAWLHDCHDLTSGETTCWQAVTPVRLRHRGRNAKKEEVAESLAKSVARKARMVAAMHAIAAPAEHLPAPICSSLLWHDTKRARRQGEEQPQGGWLMRAHWSAPDPWRPWLALMRQLGVGGQTVFGCGRFICITPCDDGK